MSAGARRGARYIPPSTHTLQTTEGYQLGDHPPVGTVNVALDYEQLRTLARALDWHTDLIEQKRAEREQEQAERERMRAAHGPARVLAFPEDRAERAELRRRRALADMLDREAAGLGRRAALLPGGSDAHPGRDPAGLAAAGPAAQAEMISRLRAGGMTIADICAATGLSRATAYRRISFAEAA